MNSFYNSIYISPHLDDAVLSCGGQVYDQVQSGRSVLVVTINAGDPNEINVSPFARTLHQRWHTPAEAVSIRREEDRRACGQLGADFLHWGLLDCIYRQDTHSGLHMYPTEESLFGAIHPGDDVTSHYLNKLISGLPRFKQLFVPLAIGNHVDHQLCRQAAENICGPTNLTYYEDYPYSQLADKQEAVFPDKEKWLSSVIQLSRSALANKLEAIAQYDSQLSTFFENKEDMVNKVRSYHTLIGGERLWRLSQYAT